MAENSGQEWSEEQLAELRELAGANTPVGVMSVKLGRSEAAIRARAEAEGITLAPPNRPPYGTTS